MHHDVAALYRAHGDVVLRRATAILGNVDDAKEVLQDIFVELVRDPSRFRGESSPTTFLYAATTHRCLRRLRDSKNRRRLVEERVAPHTAKHAAPRAEQLSMLRNLLAQLPDDLAIVATYTYVDGMSQAEIAPVVGCSRRQVGNLLERFHAQARAVVGESATASTAATTATTQTTLPPSPSSAIIDRGA